MFTHNCLLLIFFQKKKKKHFPHVFQSVVIICILIVIHVCCPRERLEKTRGLEQKKNHTWRRRKNSKRGKLCWTWLGVTLKYNLDGGISW